MVIPAIRRKSKYGARKIRDLIHAPDCMVATLFWYIKQAILDHCLPHWYVSWGIVNLQPTSSLFDLVVRHIFYLIYWFHRRFENATLCQLMLDELSKLVIFTVLVKAKMADLCEEENIDRTTPYMLDGIYRKHIMVQYQAVNVKALSFSIFVHPKPVIRGITLISFGSSVACVI